MSTNSAIAATPAVAVSDGSGTPTRTRFRTRPRRRILFTDKVLSPLDVRRPQEPRFSKQDGHLRRLTRGSRCHYSRIRVRERTRGTDPASGGSQARPHGGGVRKKSSVLVRERPAVKYAAIADWADRDEYPVDFMCKQLAVSPSGFYAWRGRVPSPRDQDNDRLLAIITEAYRRLRGNPGVRRIHAELCALGERVGKNRVARLMQAAGLRGRHPRAWKRTTTSGPDPAPAPDLIGRDFTAERPNQKWCSDITYIKTWNGWAYLAIVIDLHSRAVVGWALADHMRTDLVIEALTLAIARRRPPAGIMALHR
ncbi:MAG: IS3 family transposase [Kocuria rhizophila]|nr:MAG: IS3 family transposase [Kocuria rhizophila]